MAQCQLLGNADRLIKSELFDVSVDHAGTLNKQLYENYPQILIAATCEPALRLHDGRLDTGILDIFKKTRICSDYFGEIINCELFEALLGELVRLP
ncbi:hypothetical protein BIV25_01520 [Streptomyces sp. MUSC 14]|nr:hypothetical protein BIV25_01520 [Streptomyces sp. MUSC 14]